MEHVNYQEAKSPEEIKEQTLEYLKSCYEDSFTVQSATAPSWAENYETITVASEKYQGRTFQVRRIHQKDGAVFTDNYFTLYMEADALAYVSGLVGNLKNRAELSVAFTEVVRPSALDAQASFSDYVRMGGSPFFYITVTTKEELPEDVRMEILEKFAEQSFQCSIIFSSDHSEQRYAVDGDSSIRFYR